MLTEIYVEALLVNEELADQVWEARHHAEFGIAHLLALVHSFSLLVYVLNLELV